MLAGLGAHLAGMSTVLEVIAARHMGLRCLVLSLVSNLGAGVAEESLSHDEVLEAGRQAAGSVGAPARRAPRGRRAPARLTGCRLTGPLQPRPGLSSAA